MSKVRVAICTDGIYPYSVGGMQKHSRHLIESLALFPDLELIVLHPHKEGAIGIKEISEVPVQGIDEKRNYLLECYRYSRRIYDKIRDLKPDLVYSQGLSVWYGIDQLECRVIVNPHGLEPFQAVGFKERLIAVPFKAIFRYVFRHSGIIISLGGKLTRILQQNARGIPIRTIPNGVISPGKQLSGENEDQKTRVLFFARFAHNKGIDILFEAIDILKQKGLFQQFVFIMAGKGPLYERYKHRESENLMLPGYIQDEEVPDLYRTSDVFVLPTLYEGMPTVVLEAMSYGLPVIVSDVGATSELVDDSNGRLIQAGSATDLADALTWFSLLDRKVRSRLSAASVAKVDASFTWQTVAAKYYELFNSVAAGKTEYQLSK